MYFKELTKNGGVLLTMNLYQYNNSYDLNDDYVTDNIMFHVNVVGNVFSETVFNTYRPIVRHDYYLVYVCSGSYCIETQLGSFSMKENEFIIISPNMSHHNIHAESNKLYYCCMHFTGYAVNEILKSLDLKPDTVYKSSKSSDSVEQRFNKIIEEFKLYDTFYQTAAAGHAISLLAYLSRSTSNPTHRRMLRSSLSYISENINSDLYIEMLAQIENMSVQHYRQVFKEYTGVSPNQYIMNERLALGCEMLIHTSYSVSEIARHCGYSDSLYFSRIFKKRFGVSPLIYRKNNNLFHV